MANSCKELGCSACCSETCLTQRIPIDDKTYTNMFAIDGIRIKEVSNSNFPGYAASAEGYKDEYDVIVSPITNPKDGALFWLVQLTAACPRLFDGECSIYKDRPVSCILFPADKHIGGASCNDLRRQRGLPDLENK